MLRRYIFLPLLSFLLIAQCHQTRILPIPVARNGVSRADAEGHSKSYIMGFYEGKPFEADCRDGVESLRISKGVADSMIQIIIGGLFSTRTVEVRCIRPHLDVDGLDGGQTVRLQGVYFDSNSSTLQGDSALVLDELVDYMLSHPSAKIHIVGHTDLNGSGPANDQWDDLARRDCCPIPRAHSDQREWIPPYDPQEPSHAHSIPPVESVRSYDSPHNTIVVT